MSVIGYNSAAVNAAYYLNQNTAAQTSAIQELASGSRIANASNDAAGVAVSGQMTASIDQLGAAAQGAQDVISFAQTTDGFLSTIQQQLTRMSELAQEATNGSFGSADRANYATEFTALQTQINSITSSAKFNGTSLFSTTSGAPTSISVAIDSTGTTDSFTTATIGDTTSLGIGASACTIGTTTAAASAIGLLNTAITSLTQQRAAVNASISKFNFYVQNIQTESTNLQAANSSIADVDVATESTQLAKENILVQASSSMLAQANSSQNSLLTLLQGH